MGNKQASEALLKGINYAIENKLNKAPMDKTFTGVIKNIKEGNIYDVLIQGKIYTNIPSIFNGLNINETVKIKVPQNQYSQMYIEGKYNTKLTIPSKLPNPYSLIFKGAVIEKYDGSKEVTVTIPSAGGESGTSNYNDLVNKPSINDITLEGNKTLEELNIQPKGNYLTEEEDPTVPEYVKKISELDINNWNNKSNFSGDYNDLQNKPTIPTKTSELINDSNFVSDANYVHTDNNYTTAEKDKLSGIQNGAEVNVQSDWNETDSSSDSYIKNKPIIPSVPEYTIEEVSATSGYLKTYQLKKDSAYVGAKINIPKDMVVSSGSVKTVTQTDVPYSGAVIGDKYIDLVIANATSSHIYIPVKDLVDVYTAGTSISVSDSNVISVVSDTELSETSVNPVQNKVIKNALDGKLATTGNASNVTNTFTQASSRTNLTTGEKLSISLGKIMKWFADLKAVAFSGSYNDLTNKPTSLPANGGNADTVDNVHVDNSSTGNALWTAEKIMSQIESSKSIGYQYTGTVEANEIVNMTIPSITDYKTPNVEVLVFIDEVWQKAIHGIDYVYAFTSSTNLRVTFFNAGQYKVNYFFMASGSFPNFITSETQPTTQNQGDYWFEIL